jgi:hypothetical protein
VSEPEWAHLIRLVDALALAGGPPREGGFLISQGGADCWMTQPLDGPLVRRLVDGDAEAAKITVTPDEVFCRHCWASIHGPAIH